METAGVNVHKIIVTGMGPGAPEYMLPAARQAIEAAPVLVGGKRALASYARGGQKTCAITGDVPAVIAFISSELKQSDVCVLVSGDPGYYSLLDALRAQFPQERVQVIPGLSAMQLAFARLALPWHDADFLSFHGREPERSSLAYAPGRLLGLLTDGKHTSRTIPKLLLAQGWPGEARLHICQRLSYPDEEIFHTQLSASASLPELAHGILIVEG